MNTTTTTTTTQPPTAAASFNYAFRGRKSLLHEACLFVCQERQGSIDTAAASTAGAEELFQSILLLLVQCSNGRIIYNPNIDFSLQEDTIYDYMLESWPQSLPLLTRCNTVPVQISSVLYQNINTVCEYISWKREHDQSQSPKPKPSPSQQQQQETENNKTNKQEVKKRDLGFLNTPNKGTITNPISIMEEEMDALTAGMITEKKASTKMSTPAAAVATTAATTGDATGDATDAGDTDAGDTDATDHQFTPPNPYFDAVATRQYQQEEKHNDRNETPLVDEELFLAWDPQQSSRTVLPTPPPAPVPAPQTTGNQHHDHPGQNSHHHHFYSSNPSSSSPSSSIKKPQSNKYGYNPSCSYHLSSSSSSSSSPPQQPTMTTTRMNEEGSNKRKYDIGRRMIDDMSSPRQQEKAKKGGDHQHYHPIIPLGGGGRGGGEATYKINSRSTTTTTTASGGGFLTIPYTSEVYEYLVFHAKNPSDVKFSKLIPS